MSTCGYTQVGNSQAEYVAKAGSPDFSSTYKDKLILTWFDKGGLYKTTISKQDKIVGVLLELEEEFGFTEEDIMHLLNSIHKPDFKKQAGDSVFWVFKGNTLMAFSGLIRLPYGVADQKNPAGQRWLLVAEPDLIDEKEITELRNENDKMIESFLLKSAKRYVHDSIKLLEDAVEAWPLSVTVNGNRLVVNAESRGPNDDSRFIVLFSVRLITLAGNLPDDLETVEVCLGKTVRKLSIKQARALSKIANDKNIEDCVNRLLQDGK